MKLYVKEAKLVWNNGIDSTKNEKNQHSCDVKFTWSNIVIYYYFSGCLSAFTNLTPTAHCSCSSFRGCCGYHFN